MLLEINGGGLPKNHRHNHALKNSFHRIRPCQNGRKQPRPETLLPPNTAAIRQKPQNPQHRRPRAPKPAASAPAKSTSAKNDPCCNRATAKKPACNKFHGCWLLVRGSSELLLSSEWSPK